MPHRGSNPQAPGQWRPRGRCRTEEEPEGEGEGGEKNKGRWTVVFRHFKSVPSSLTCVND